MDIQGVARTNDDATARKIHAARKGYWKDDFAPLLLPALYAAQAPIQNSPVMNRGFWLRVDFFSLAVTRFIEQVAGGRAHQIVNLGAGYDTSFYRLGAEGVTNEKTTWVDVDLPDIITAKQRVLASMPSQPPGTLHSLSQDLRDVAGLFRHLATVLRKDIPTLFVCECVLVYLDPADSDAIVAAAASQYPLSGFLSYDAVRGDDAFGVRMCVSLRQRGCELRGIGKYNAPSDHTARYIACGYPHAAAADMSTYAKCVYRARPEALAMLNRLERLDEVEEWELIHRHYALSFGAVWGPEVFAWLHAVFK